MSDYLAQLLNGGGIIALPVALLAGVVAGLSAGIAAAGVNITRMHLGPVGDEGLAVAVIGLDRSLPQDARETILALDTVLGIHELDF